jgi:hypothetical protein
LISAYERMVERRATIPVEDRPLLDDVKDWLIRFYESRGQPDKARSWRESAIPPA